MCLHYDRLHHPQTPPDESSSYGMRSTVRVIQLDLVRSATFFSHRLIVE